jgi:MFS family permease
MALCIPLGFACGAIYPSVLTTLMEYSGDRKATATAMITTATGIGGAAFTALTGILAGGMGLRGAMVALSAFFILSFISVLLLDGVNKWKEKNVE